MKKVLSMAISLMFIVALLAGCNSGKNESSSTSNPATSSSGEVKDSSQEDEDVSSETNNDSGNFDEAINITVVSREDGSGTRGAFIELFGLEEKQEDGTKLDRTTMDAVFINSTSIMMTTIAGDPYAIGYISLGSLNDSVKALEVDGAQPTVENIKNGSYKISRPFNIAVNADLSEAAQDFIDFILSNEGQEVILNNGYIPLDNMEDYAGTKPSGKVVVAGSSSVNPVMEKLKEAYNEINPNCEIEIQQSDSSTGMNAAIEGICDIGMASRELKDSELEAGLESKVIAMDGIALIVNKENPMDDISSETVKQIYAGEIETWAETK